MDLVPEKIDTDAFLRDLLDDDRSMPHPDRLTHRAAIRLSWRRLTMGCWKPIMTLTCTKTEMEELSYVFQHADDGQMILSEMAEQFPFRWGAMEGDRRIRYALISRIWNTTFQLVDNMLSHPTGKDFSLMSYMMKAIKAFGLIIFDATPTLYDAKKAHAKREKDAQRNYSSASVNYKAGRKPSKAPKQPVEPAAPLLPPFQPPTTPTEEQSQEIFSMSVSFLPELFDLLLRVLASPRVPSVEYHGDALAVIQLLLAHPRVRKWMFQPAQSSLVTTLVESAFTMLQSPTSDPLNETDNESDFDSEPDDPADSVTGSLATGQRLLKFMIGFAGEEEGQVKENIIRSILHTSIEILRAYQQFASPSSPPPQHIPDAYEFRAAIFALHNLVSKHADMATKLFTIDVVQQIVDALDRPLMDHTQPKVAIDAAFASLRSLHRLPAALYFPCIPSLYEKLLQSITNPSVPAIHKIRQVTFLRDFVNVAPTEMIVQGQGRSAQPAPAGNNLVLTLFSLIQTELKTPSPGASVVVEDQATIGELLIMQAIFALRAMGVHEYTEIENRFAPYAKAYLEVALDLMTSAEKPSALLEVMRCLPLAIWRAVPFEVAMEFLPKFHTQLVRIMLLETRTKSGTLDDLTEEARADAFSLWAVLVELAQGRFEPYMVDCVRFMQRLLHKSYRWPHETRPSKLAARAKKATANSEEKDGASDEEADEEQAETEEEKGDVGDDDADDADSGEEDGEDGEDEDEEDDDEVDSDDSMEVDGVVYRSKWAHGQIDAETMIQCWAALCEFVGPPFRNAHEKILLPLLIPSLSTYQGSNVISQLDSLVRVIPTLYGQTWWIRKGAVFGEHYWPVSKIGPNSKTLIKKCRDPHTSLHDQLITTEDGQATELLDMYDQLLDSYGLDFWSVGTSGQNANAHDESGDPDREPEPEKKQRRTAKIGPSSGRGFSRASKTKIKPGSHAKSKPVAPLIDQHVDRIRELTRDCIFVLRGMNLGAVLPLDESDEFQEDDGKVSEDTDIRDLEDNVLHKLHRKETSEEHLCDHRCMTPCRITQSMETVQSAFRALGSLVKAAGEFFSKEEEEGHLKSIMSLMYRVGAVPQCRGMVTWFIGDLVDGLAHGHPGKLIRPSLIESIFRPAYEFVLSTLERPTDERSDIFSTTSAILAISDVFCNDCQLPLDVLGSYINRTVMLIEKQIALTIYQCTLFRQRRGITSKLDEWQRNKISSLGSQWSPTSVAFEPNRVQYKMLQTHLDECSHTLDLMLACQRFMDYFRSSPDLAHLPKRIVQLFFCTLPLRVEKTSADFIYGLICKLRTWPEVDEDDQSFLQMVIDFALAKHQHDGDALSPEVLKQLQPA